MPQQVVRSSCAEHYLPCPFGETPRRDPTSQQVLYLTQLILREVNAAMKVFLLLWYGWMVQAHISSFQNGRDIIKANEGERRGFILGKDTELFHACVDLNWLTRTLTDKSTWTSWYCSVVHRLKRLNSGYNNEYTYQNVAIDLISEFRELNPSSPIRLEGFERSFDTENTIILSHLTIQAISVFPNRCSPHRD
jgi:hypothetical protein